MTYMFASAGVKDEATDKTVKAYAALTLVSSCCHGVCNTTLIKPENAGDKKFEWFDDVQAKLNKAKDVAKKWINDISPAIRSNIPTSVIEYVNLFQECTDYIIEVCKTHPGMKKGDAEFKEVNELLKELQETIKKEIISSIEKSRTDLKNWGESLQKAHDDLSGKVQTVQKAEIDLSEEINKVNADISTLNSLISSEQTLVAVGAGLVGSGVFVAVVGIALIASGVGAVAGGIVIGVGAAGVIGGAVTWGVMQARINEQYDKIAEDRKSILQDNQLLASLKGIELSTSSAVSYMQTALGALDEVRTIWEGFYNVINATVNDLNKAEERATVVLKRVFTRAAKNQWNDAHKMAEKLLDANIKTENKGVMGDKVA